MPSRRPHDFTTLLDLLEKRGERHPERTSHTFHEDGTDTSFTFAELRGRARSIAAALQQRQMEPGERALLIYPPGLEYIAGFFGCLFADIIAVPAYPPDPTRLDRTLPRLRAIIKDSGAKVVLTTSFILSMAEYIFEQAPDMGTLAWLAT